MGGVVVVVLVLRAGEEKEKEEEEVSVTGESGMDLDDAKHASLWVC